jgi:hypothetical protein
MVCPESCVRSSVVTIDATELAMLISGISLSSTNRRKRYRDASAGDGVARRDQKMAS